MSTPQHFETAGWSAVVSFTGESSDPGYGLNQFYARSYDPGTGTWASQDAYRGLLTEPQSLHRYGYVANNPIRYLDDSGFRLLDPNQCVSKTGCEARFKDAADANAQVYGMTSGWVPSRPADGSVDKKLRDPKYRSWEYTSKIHRAADPRETVCPFGWTLRQTPYTSPQCVEDKVMEGRHAREDAFIDWAAWVASVTGLASLAFPPAALVAYGAAGLTALYDCGNYDRRASQCQVDIVTLAVPGSGSVVKLALGRKVPVDVIEDLITSIQIALDVIGASKTPLGRS